MIKHKRGCDHLMNLAEIAVLIKHPQTFFFLSSNSQPPFNKPQFKASAAKYGNMINNQLSMSLMICFQIAWHQKVTMATCMDCDVSASQQVVGHFSVSSSCNSFWEQLSSFYGLRPGGITGCCTGNHQSNPVWLWNRDAV